MEFDEFGNTNPTVSTRVKELLLVEGVEERERFNVLAIDDDVDQLPTHSPQEFRESGGNARVAGHRGEECRLSVAINGNHRCARVFRGKEALDDRRRSQLLLLLTEVITKMGIGDELLRLLNRRRRRSGRDIAY